MGGVRDSSIREQEDGLAGGLYQNKLFQRCCSQGALTLQTYGQRKHLFQHKQGKFPQSVATPRVRTHQLCMQLVSVSAAPVRNGSLWENGEKQASG